MLTRRTLLKASAATGLAMPALSSARAQGATKFRWGHAMPSTHPLTTRGLEAVEAIRRETNGAIDIQIFPDNQLGGDNDMTAQVRAGGIEFYNPAATSIGPLVPLAGIVTTAFAFADSASAWKAMDGDLGKALAAAFAKVNLHVMDKSFENGFRQITSFSKPITSPADLVGYKIRVPTSPVLLSLFKSLGASPTSMNVSELYSALQTKIVDGQENPLSIIATRNFNEVQKYCALTNHSWDCFFMVANGKAWNAIPADQRAIISKHLTAAALKQREDIGTLNATLQKTLESKGMAFNRPDGAVFRDALKKANHYDQWKKTYGDEAWGTLEKYTGKLS